MRYETIKLIHGSPEWLEFRRKGIGASDAAAILGLSNWKTNQELWEEKVGLRQPKDLSGNDRVQYGADAEEYLIGLFKLQYANRYEVKVDKSVVYLRDGFQFASLDAELVDLTTKELGIQEVKTVEAENSRVWEEWRDKVPMQYYVQVLHQMLTTGRTFDILNPEFRWTDKDGEITTKVRRILIRATDENITQDMHLLDEAEHEFWGYVQRGERPPLILPQF